MAAFSSRNGSFACKRRALFTFSDLVMERASLTIACSSLKLPAWASSLLIIVEIGWLANTESSCQARVCQIVSVTYGANGCANMSTDSNKSEERRVGKEGKFRCLPD